MKKENWFFSTLKDVRHTLFPENPKDNFAKKLGKRAGWIMYLTLMTCCTLAMLLAVSFAH